MGSEFVRDQTLPMYIQFLPLIVFAIIVIIQIIYFIIALTSQHCGREEGAYNNTSMVIGLIIVIIILIILLYIVYVLCQQGWTLSAWFLVVVLIILSVLFSMPRKFKQNESVNNIVIAA